MNQRDASKEAAKGLLLSKLIYETALAKHREEKTELSRLVVTQAHLQYQEMQRDVMLQNWKIPTALLRNCPRCKGPSEAKRWDFETAPPPDPPEGGIFRPQRAVPEWAVRYVREGVESVTRFSCEACGFDMAVLAGDPS